MENKEQVGLPDEEIDPRLLELREKFLNDTITEKEKDELVSLLNENRNTKRNFLTRSSMEHEEFVAKLWEKYVG